MRITTIGSALPIVVAPVTLASCVLLSTTASPYHQQLCAEIGAPPGSPNFEECIDAIAEAIREVERQGDLEYGHVPGNILWECEIEDFESYRVHCIGRVG